MVMTVEKTDIYAIGEDLKQLILDQKNLQAIDKYYADEITSEEAMENDSFPRVMQGIDEIRKKNEMWFEEMEVQEQVIHGPYVGKSDENGGQFALYYIGDVVHKASGNRMKHAEMALYTVKNGKITYEQFFSGPTQDSNY